MDRQLTKTSVSDKTPVAQPGHSEAEETTRRLLTDAQSKYHVSNVGSTIESVKQTSSGYDVTVAKGGHDESIKIGRDEVGSAMTLALMGPDIYRSIHEPNVVGDRLTTIVGGTMMGAAEAAKKEWTTDPAKAISNGALNIVTAAGLAVCAEAAPVFSSGVGAVLLGTAGAQLVHAFPELAQKSESLQKAWSQAGHESGATTLDQSKHIAQTVGPDAYRLGYTVLTAAAGARLGFALKPEVPVNLEASAMQAATQLGQAAMQAMRDVPKMLNGAFQPTSLRFAFATAMSEAQTFEAAASKPGILNMAALKDNNWVSSGGEKTLRAAADTTRIAVKLTEKEIAPFKNAERPEDVFPSESGWEKYHSAKTPGPIYIRESEAVVNGKTVHTTEHFIPGKLYSIASKGNGEDYEVVMDLARQVETLTNNLERQAQGLGSGALKITAEKVQPMVPQSPPELTGDGKYTPHNWLPPHTKK